MMQENNSRELPGDDESGKDTSPANNYSNNTNDLNPTEVKTKPRYHLLDEIRGFAVVCMIFYHGFFTVGIIFHISAGESLLKFFMPIEPLFAGVFIFISGTASQLTRSNLKRGGKLLLVALAMTAVTYMLTPGVLSAPIWFGILHMLSVAMLLAAPLNPLIRKAKPLAAILAGILVCGVLFLLTMGVREGYLGLSGFTVQIPEAVMDQGGWLFPLGVILPRFSSSDYFPIFPWIFVFFAGSFAGVLAHGNRLPAFFKKSHVRPLSFVGRHALIIYIAHQPVLFGLFFAIDKIASAVS